MHRGRFVQRSRGRLVRSPQLAAGEQRAMTPIDASATEVDSRLVRSPGSAEVVADHHAAASCGRIMPASCRSRESPADRSRYQRRSMSLASTSITLRPMLGRAVHCIGVVMTAKAPSTARNRLAYPRRPTTQRIPARAAEMGERRLGRPLVDSMNSPRTAAAASPRCARRARRAAVQLHHCATSFGATLPRRDPRGRRSTDRTVSRRRPRARCRDPKRCRMSSLRTTFPVASLIETSSDA